MRIEAVLFDADGVIQKRPSGWRSRLGGVLGFTGDPDAFLADVFAAERPALEGRCDFTEALSEVLFRWKCRGSLADALDAWTMIEVDAEVADTVRTLRRNGVACHLATNQESHKARYMSGALGYGELFDSEFYSCRMGVMKPAVAYFRAVLKRIELRPSNVLLLDDLEANVASAREAGLHAAEFTLEAGASALHRILEEFGIHSA